MEDSATPLVIGAGPVGLVMACELARHGVRCRIIDQAAQPSHSSKALAIFPRTLEHLDSMGIAKPFLEMGHRVRGLSIHHGPDRLAAVDLTAVATPFPFVLTIPQAETERILTEHLATYQLSVERDLSLTSITQSDWSVCARLRDASGREETIEVPWLIGCDGAHSTTRHALGMEFEGASYDESFILADVRAELNLPRDQVHLYLGDDGILGVIPFNEDRWRVVANIPPGTRSQQLPDLTLSDVEALVERRGLPGAKLSDAIWLSRFHISHRIVREYRKLRVLLAGDASTLR